MVQPAVILPPEPDYRWQLAKQMRVSKAVIHPLEIGNGKSDWSYGDLRHLNNWLEDADLEFSVLEGSIPLTDRIRLGQEGRNKDIKRFKQFLRNCGEIGIDVVCYDWMASVRWARTEAHLSSRGGSYVTGYDDEKMVSSQSQDMDVMQEDLWEALDHFLTEVGPVAKSAGVKLALHPDDPPLNSVGGVPRIINSPAAYERVLEIYDDEHNGITFCQGNFIAMDVDIPATISRFGKRINFIHFRDIRGDAAQFEETWHDNGPTDMFGALRAYENHVDGEVPLRPDHVPTMAGEDNSNPGYHTKGRLFAIGYIRGMKEAIKNGD